MILKKRHTTKSAPFYSFLIPLITFRWIGSFSLLVCILLAFTSSSCSSDSNAANENDRLIAKVFNKSLFQSELNDLVGDGASSEDSVQITNAYLEKWVRSAVLMHEAEKYVPEDLNIDELVRDYRASLIRHNYEKLLVEMNLDSTINKADLEDYYEENKEQYKLKQPILKARFIKVSKTREDWDSVEDWWKSDDDEDYKKLVDYCSRNAEVYMLNDSIWYYLEDVSQHLPKGKLTTSNYTNNKNLNFSDENYEYLLKVFDTTPTGQYAPLAFIKGQATKVILHKRKIQLLEEKREEMYERETSRNNVKFYLD